MTQNLSMVPVNPRRRTRVRLLAWSAPIVVVMVVIAVYLLITTFVAQAGARDFKAESYRSAESRFAFLTNVNVVETWKAYYDVGTARYATGEAFPASLALERALELVPKGAEGRAYEECLVATNLSLAYEGLGDNYVATGDKAMAKSYYEKAIATVEGCTPAVNDPEDEKDKQLRAEALEAQKRQQEKLDALQDPPPDPSPSPDPSPQPQPSPDPSPDPSPQPQPSPDPSADPSPQPQPPPSKLDELRDRNKDANGEGGDDGENPGGGGGSQNW